MLHVADCSLSLINRTGAHFVAREIVEALPDRFEAIRHWRFLSTQPPTGLWRKVLGRAMLRELRHLGTSPSFPWPLPSGSARSPVLFMDPLYVLRADLRPADLVLCHDVGPITHPELFDATVHRMYARAYDKIKAVAPAMVFVSEASRDAFTRLYGERFPRLAVIPLFVRRRDDDATEEPVPGVERPFLLTVGAFERRKNLPKSVAAFQRSGLAAKGIAYVMCGARGLDHEEVERSAENDPSVKVLSYVSDGQLRWLYRNASLFVLPSLLEGFGMPALEAAEYGLLPVVPAQGALAEATGNLGIGIDPYSVDSIAEGMRAGLERAEDDERRQKLIDHARHHSRERFVASWNELLRAEESRVA